MNKFKVGDKIICEYKEGVILDFSDDGRIRVSCEGMICTRENNYVFPARDRYKVITKLFKQMHKSIIDWNGLNWPDISRYLSFQFYRVCITPFCDHIILEVEDFISKINRFSEEIRNTSINEIKILR